MSVPNLPQNPRPLLDERAVEAAADAIYADHCGCRPYPTRTARKALAAYFAALDREALVDLLAADESLWRNPSGHRRTPRNTVRRLLEALGLFTPDTEEPT